MKIGVIGSSGGSVFQDYYRILRDISVPRDAFTVVTDRDCGLECFSRDESLDVVRIEDKDKAGFSSQAAARLASAGADFALLYFSRLVTKELFSVIPTVNIHPALLPAFPGFQAVRQAFHHGAKFLGATLHGVDASVDGGPIIAQVATPIRRGSDLVKLENQSFLQKLYLSLVLYDLTTRGHLRLSATPDGCVPELTAEHATAACNPALQDPRLIERFRAVEAREGSRVID